MFFPGEAAAKGLDVFFSGAYLGAGGICGLFAPPLVAWLTQYMNIGDLQRIALCAMAVVTIPQGLGLLLPSPEAFGAFEITLRVLEGLPYIVLEQGAATHIMRLFPSSREYTAANGAFMGVRTLVSIVSAPLGGGLYKTLGMVGPYMCIGAAMVLFSLFARCSMSHAVSAGGVHRNAPIAALLRIPACAPPPASTRHVLTLTAHASNSP
jgi:hypothetical protein